MTSISKFSASTWQPSPLDLAPPKYSTSSTLYSLRQGHSQHQGIWGKWPGQHDCTISENLIFNISIFLQTLSVTSPGAHSDILTNDRMGGLQQSFIFYTQKNPNFRIWLPKKIPTFIAFPQKSHTSSKLRLCYCWCKLMKDIKAQKIPAFFANHKNPDVFHKPKKIPLD